MAVNQIRGLGDSAAPVTYTVPGAQEIVVNTLFASFDGSGTASSWFPCIRVIGPGGGVVGEFLTARPVTAGGSADATFGPFLMGTSASGIQFDTDNRGDWLEVTTSDVVPNATGAGIYLEATGPGGIELTTDQSLELFGDSGVDITATGHNDPIQIIGDGNVLVEASGTGDLTVTQTGTATIDVNNTGGGDVTVRTKNGAGLLSLTNEGSGITFVHSANSTVQATGAGIILEATQGGSVGVTFDAINARLQDHSVFVVQHDGGGAKYFYVGDGGLFMPGLPVVNPGVAGQVWNNGGVLNIV